VTLTSTAQGRFSNNAMLVTPAQPVELSFVPFIAGEVANAQNTRVEHVALYTTGLGVDALSNGGSILGSALAVDV
jgi:hypothetical protein